MGDPFQGIESAVVLKWNLAMESKESAGSMERKAERKWRPGGRETSIRSSSAMVDDRVAQIVYAEVISCNENCKSGVENRAMDQIQTNSSTVLPYYDL